MPSGGRAVSHRPNAYRRPVPLSRTLLANNLDMRRVQVDCVLAHLRVVRCIPSASVVTDENCLLV